MVKELMIYGNVAATNVEVRSDIFQWPDGDPTREN